MNEVAQIAALGLDQVIDSAIHDRRIVGTVTMLAAAPEILDLPPEQPLLETEMIANFVRQMQVVLLGASRWRDKPLRPPAPQVPQAEPAALGDN